MIAVHSSRRYSILKVARYLFTWSGAPIYADFYERAILNGLFGVLRMPLNYEPHQHEDCDHHQRLPESFSADVARYAAFSLLAIQWTVSHVCRAR